MNPGSVLLLLAGAYLLYQYMQPAPAPPAQVPGTPPLKTAGGPAVLSGAPGTTLVGAPANPIPPLPAPPPFNTLASTYARFVANVSQNKADPAITTPNNVLTASFDVWNYYLAQVTGVSLPYSSQVNPNWTGGTRLGIDAYWSGMAQWLSANAGMSGLRAVRVPAFMSGGWN